MDKVLSALLGTIVGFFLSWFKEYIQSRPKVKINLKSGKLNYLKKEANSYGDIIETIVVPEKANRFYLSLQFDIFNIGKVGTGITDISIKLSANKNSLYYQPNIILPIENKNMDNISFNLESNKVLTIETLLHVTNEGQSSFVFKETSLLPEEEERLKIEVIIEDLNKEKLSLLVEPMSILTA